MGISKPNSGDKYWFKDGVVHREDGPAIEFANGTKQWFINGECHRLNGPALERPDGQKIWFYHSRFVPCHSQEEFERLIKLAAFW